MLLWDMLEEKKSSPESYRFIRFMPADSNYDAKIPSGYFQHDVAFSFSNADTVKFSIDKNELPLINTAGFLISLIEEAKKIEWESEISIVKNDYKDNDPAFIKLLEYASNLGAQSFLLSIGKESKTIGDKFGRKEISRLEKLKNVVPKINTARNTFILPNIRETEEKAIESSKTLISLMKDQIVEMLGDYSRRSIPYLYAFMKDATQPKYINMYDEFKEMLFPLIHGWFKKQYQYDLLSEGPLLLVGEHGSGKTSAVKAWAMELKARKQSGPFFSVSLSAIPETMIDDHMRGHIKNYASGQPDAKPGWFEEANQGILFLDDFQSAPLEFQPRFLDLLSPCSNRVQIARLGEESKPRTCQVKTFVAVNEPIETLLERGQLREDLFYRIGSIIKFPSFADFLKPENTSFRDDLSPTGFLRKLIWIYRHIHPLDRGEYIRRDQIIYNSENAISNNKFFETNLDALFPCFDASFFNQALTIAWKGNFRLFEKVIYKIFMLFEKGEMSANMSITAETLNKIIQDIDLSTQHKKQKKETQTAVLITDYDRQLIARIEEVFTKHNGHKKMILDELRKSHNIRTMYTLRQRLIQYYNNFSDEIRNHPKMKGLTKQIDFIEKQSIE